VKTALSGAASDVASRTAADQRDQLASPSRRINKARIGDDDSTLIDEVAA
jgi:hypothetical protein